MIALAMLLVVVPIAQTQWELPVTVRVLRDVQARGYTAEEHGTQAARGILYIALTARFVIRKFQTFQMVKIYAEGGCRIRFQNREHDVASCPWLDGFRDHQADIFEVLPKK
jgi:hypothetical protein